jgi:hypothetical protein
VAENETFLGRWSRLKQEDRKEEQLPEKKADTEAAPQLPPMDELTTDSDFTGFMHPKVGAAVRRVALKKLFTDPHFNTPDPFEPFSGDWTVEAPIPDEMMKTLHQARTHLFGDKDEAKPEASQAEASQAEVPEAEQQHTATRESPKEEDEPGRKNT